MDLAVPYEVTVAQTGPPLCVNHLRNVQIWKHYIIMLQPPKENNHHGDAFTFDCVNGQVKWYIVPSKYCDKDSTWSAFVIYIISLFNHYPLFVRVPMEYM